MQLMKFFSHELYQPKGYNHKKKGFVLDCLGYTFQSVLAIWLTTFVVLCVIVPGVLFAADSPQTDSIARDFPITVDPTALTPPTSWQVPGVTPLIYTMDPISSDAFKTIAGKELWLKPGQYRFGTYTFNFPFVVSRLGLLEFDMSLNQCVEGRGTKTLTVVCSHTQPYPQQPDY